MNQANRAAEMGVFVEVVRSGSFSAAARSAGISPSTVSKLVARMEVRLGARLFVRSTRRLSLTSEGEAFHARASAILADIEEAERAVGRARLPSGRIGIGTSASYLAHALTPALPAFAEAYPEITLDIMQTDAISELIGERLDVAIRAGPLADSALISRSLGETPLVTVAAPSWLETHDGGDSPTIGFSYGRRSAAWSRPTAARPPRMRVNDGEAIRHLALAGLGSARLARFTVRRDIDRGRLVEVFASADVEVFHAVYVGRADALPARAAALIDHLARHGRVDG